MQPAKLFTTLQILVNILLFTIGIWIVFYAFEYKLPALIGPQFFYNIYHLLRVLIAVISILVFILAVLYVLAARNQQP